MEDSVLNIEALEQELDWFDLVARQAVSSYLMHEGYEQKWHEIDPPDLSESDTCYALFVKENNLTLHERLALALTMAPHIRPDSLDIFFGKNQLYDRPFTEFGGYLDNGFSGFLPTVQTLVFICAGVDKTQREKTLSVVAPDAFLPREQVLTINITSDRLPFVASILKMPERWMHYFETGTQPHLEHSSVFPAQQISTELDWEDVVLEESIMEELHEINTWLTKGETLLNDWGLSKRIKPGYRTLFYGPPGTGKTLTATLLGKTTGKEVYRIDLSMIVSKYIGETEKNLARIFDIAEHKNWILFFDEADSLFGRRTAAQSSNDRHANQQTGYLLQRIEDYPGVVILASNLKDNIDPAFTRRFQSMIHFKMPGTEERFRLWKNAFSGACKLDDSVDIYALSENYELAGGAIINVLRHCALAAIRRDSETVTKAELLSGLRKEFAKDHKTIENKFI